MILRVVNVTTLLVCAFAIELLLRPGEAIRPLFFLAAVAYGMVLLYAGLDRWLKGTRAFLYVQLIGDALVVSGFVGMTGSLDSPMSFLYLLPIVVRGYFFKPADGGDRPQIKEALNPEAEDRRDNLIAAGQMLFVVAVGVLGTLDFIPYIL